MGKIKDLAMDFEDEIEGLKRSIIALQTCINDIHNRISDLEKKNEQHSQD